MVNYGIYITLVCFIVFMIFIIGEIEQYKISSDIENVDFEDVEDFGITDYLSIFWNILTFNLESGTEDIPLWFNIFVAIPLYALITLLIADIIGNTINPFG